MLSVLHCLQRVLQQSTVPDGFPISQEVKDHIHHLVTTHLPAASMMPPNNSIMTNSTPMMSSNASMMGTTTSILSSSLANTNTLLPNTTTNQLIASSTASNPMLPNTNSMSSNILGTTNMGALGGMSSLQNKLPQLMSQNNTPNPVSKASFPPFTHRANYTGNYQLIFLGHCLNYRSSLSLCCIK